MQPHKAGILSRKKLFNFHCLISFAGLTLFHVVTTATFASDFHSPRTLALGGAGHAGPLLNDAVYLNPSFCSFLPAYSISGNFLSYSGSENAPSQVRGKVLNASVQDGRSELFQAGAGYTSRDDASFFHLGMSKTVHKRVAVGLGGKMFFNRDSKHTSGQDLIVATSYIPAEWVQTALIVDNAVESNASKYKGLYREIIIGTKFNMGSKLLLYLDPHYTPRAAENKFGHELGAEVAVFTDLFVRFGTFKNATVPYLNGRGRGYGGGVGWVAPRISLDYGLSHAISPASVTAHTFGATVYF